MIPTVQENHFCFKDWKVGIEKTVSSIIRKKYTCQHFLYTLTIYRLYWIFWIRKKTGTEGFEPPTRGFGDLCSTPELCPCIDTTYNQDIPPLQVFSSFSVQTNNQNPKKNLLQTIYPRNTMFSVSFFFYHLSVDIMAKYKHKDAEQQWQDFWQQHQIYAFDPNSDKPTYSIDTPPPTISGKLHIGHVSSYTQAECIARYKRMTGHNVYYPMGYDDNGIPTEILVEKELKINIKNTPRAEFVQKCMEVNQKYRDIYKNFWIWLGFSVDRHHSYATISPLVQQLVQQRFVDLYHKGLIQHKEFPALRCTANQTTIAQAETEDKEFDEFFNDIAFTLSDGSELIIATTRPEMLPACVAVFVHPDDQRYTAHLGKDVTTPLGKTVPLLTDDKVKMDKGTGAVMCCSYGDETDMYWIQKHKLPVHIIINRYGKMQETWLTELDDLKVKDARVAIIDILQQKWVIRKREAIKQSKAISERGKIAVEILPVKQRFVSLLDHKDKLKDTMNAMAWKPEHMKKRAFDWIDNLQRDRNISRSRKFGIPLPVRYDQDDNVILPSAEQLARGHVDPASDLPDGYTADQVRGEEMVLDTRFTSGLSPDINQAIVHNNGSDKNILPMTLRPMAHDIIRTWLLYTVLHSMHHHDRAPFDDVMISWHVLAGKGEKISKSKGNAAFEPEQLIEHYGADVTRYWTLSAQLGKDLIFDDTTLKNGKKLVTKLWNAANFVQMQLADTDMKTLVMDKSLGFDNLYATDQWILLKLDTMVTTMRTHLDGYEYGLAKITFEEFFWKDFCDNYLELVKTRVYKPEEFENGEHLKRSGQVTLYYCLYTIIRCMAPYLPHITEQLYQDYFRQYENHLSIHQTSFPEATHQTDTINKISVSDFFHVADIAMDALSQVRKYKSDNQISLGAEVETVIVSGDKEHQSAIHLFQADLQAAMKAKNIQRQQGDYDISIA